jgi:hypothetical protein
MSQETALELGAWRPGGPRPGPHEDRGICVARELRHRPPMLKGVGAQGGGILWFPKEIRAADAAHIASTAPNFQCWHMKKL